MTSAALLPTWARWRLIVWINWPAPTSGVFLARACAYRRAIVGELEYSPTPASEVS